MNSVKLVYVPFASHFNLSSSLCRGTTEEKEYISLILYANAIEILM
jgi:hypothetical protein